MSEPTEMDALVARVTATLGDMPDTATILSRGFGADTPSGWRFTFTAADLRALLAQLEAAKRDVALYREGYARRGKVIQRAWKKASLDFKYVDARGVLREVNEVVSDEFAIVNAETNAHAPPHPKALNPVPRYQRASHPPSGAPENG